MQERQLADLFDDVLAEPQFPQALPDQLGPHHLVVVEADAAARLEPSGGRLADVVQQGGQPQHQVGTVLSPARSPGRAPSGSARRRPCAGGARRAPGAAPVARAAPARPARCRSAGRSPARGSAPQTSLVSSAAIRSTVIRASCPDIAVIASTTRGAGTNRSSEANRAARSIRSGSSRNECSGVPGVSSTRSASWRRPPYGSLNACPGTDTAIALTAKSRRTRSSANVSPNVTVGFRVSPS